MQTYTQADYDSFPVVAGMKQCPSGDYSQIIVFAARCSFGEWCRFGEGCSFGERCSFGEGCRFEGCSFGERCRFDEGCRFEGYPAKPGYPFLTFGGGGSENRTVYCFNTTNGLIFKAGCFTGNTDEFVEKVLADDETENKSSIKTRQYMGFVELCNITFGDSK